MENFTIELGCVPDWRSRLISWLALKLGIGVTEVWGSPELADPLL